MRIIRGLVLASALAAPAAGQEPVRLTIATVNNPDMIRMQRLAQTFVKDNPDIGLDWVTMGEGELRRTVGTDIALGGGRFDVLTLGTYEVPIWGGRGWLVPLDDLPEDYGVEDLLPGVRDGLSVEGRLFAVPFYGESSFTMVRTDLLDRAGLTLPEAPTWDEIRALAEALHDPEAGVHGICLRGKPGWGENMALVGAMANSLGARWFDEDWRPQFDTPEWAATLDLYLDLMALAPPGAEGHGFNEVLALFEQGSCAIWIDATVAASVVNDPDESAVAGRVGFAMAPDAGLGRRANWLWAWALAVPASSDAPEEARRFVAWATSRDYAALVAKQEGWAAAPPGTRRSLYQNPDYLTAAPFAPLVLRSIQAADPLAPTVDPVPYTGVQFVAIPEFQGLGDAVGREVAAALSGAKTPQEALADAQELALQQMTAAGYLRR
jgi:sorbitol/mannitol transport system substrate-binding protein